MTPAYIPSPPPYRCLLIALCALLSIAGTPPMEGQTTKQAVRLPVKTARPPRGSVVIGGGVTLPLSHRVVVDFWSPGPSVSLSAYRNVNRMVSLGIGAEAALFSFDASGFGQAFPGVVPHPLKLGYIHLFVGWKFTMLPGSAVTPVAGATIGASKLTKALHQERVLGVRTTYYDIPGRLRLTGGGSLGLDVNTSRLFGFGLEGRINYLLNDPEASVIASGRLTARLLLD